MTKEKRKRLATVRVLASIASKEHQPDEVEVKEGGDESPPEDLPQASHASHFS